MLITGEDLDRVLAELPPDPQANGAAPKRKSTGAGRVEYAPDGRVSADYLLRRYVGKARAGSKDGTGRNDAGKELAIQLRDNDYSREEAEPVMRAYVEAVGQEGPHPYVEREAMATLRSIYSRPPRQPWARAAASARVRFDRANGKPTGQATGASTDPAEEGPPPEAPATEPGDGEAPAADSFHLTDDGNARRVIQEHGADLRYCHPWHSWLIWDCQRWKGDATAEAERRVKRTRDGLFKWAARKIEELGEVTNEDDEERKAALEKYTRILRHCLKWEDARRVSASLQLARSEPTVPVLPEDLDRDPWSLNCLNGTLDLRTGLLRPHRREDLLTKLAPVEYQADATCPRWLRFLDRIMDSNQDVIDYLQRVIGYALTGDVSEQCLFFFHGVGANGKSTFLGTIQAMLGDYAIQAVSELLMVKHNESHPTERADLFGRRFVATIETEEGRRMAEALMKQLTGGDKIKARWMRKDFFEFKPTHKIFLAANHKPAVRGLDHAVWRRIKLVPFTVTITAEEKDKALPDKLLTELPGIFVWAVRGCLDWQRNGIGEPEEVRVATDQYQAEQDALAGFIAESCFVHRETKCKVSAFLEAYHTWSGERLMTQKEMGKRMRDKGFESARGHGGAYFYQGIGISPVGPQVTLGGGAGEPR